MPEYQFVVSGGQPRPADRAVRSHAMRTALQKRATQAENMEEQIADSRLTESSKAALKGRFRLVSRPKKKKRGQLEEIELHVAAGSLTEEASPPGPGDGRGWGPVTALGKSSRDLQPRRQLLSREGAGGAWPFGGFEVESGFVEPEPEPQPEPISAFGSGYLDPFGSVPVPHNRQVDMLVRFFLTKFLLNMSTADTQKHWFSFSMREPLIMHTTLALSGNGWLASTAKPDPRIRQEVLHQKGQAIKAINELLTRAEVSDTLIAGVANLANVSTFEGSFREADVHLRGLKRLVDLRGGYEAFKDAHLVTRSVTWADLQAAAALGRPPIFPLVYEETATVLPQSILDDAEVPSLAHVENMGPGGAEAAATFIFIRRAMLVCQRAAASSEIIRLHMHIADGTLSHLLFDGNAQQQRVPPGSPLRPLLLAAHVFLYAAMRQVPRKGAVCRTLVDRLADSLQPERLDPLVWKDHLPALLWALFVGASAAVPPPPNTPASGSSAATTTGGGGGGGGGQHWLRTRLETVCRIVQPASKESLRDMLRTFVWAEKYCDPFLDEVWSASYPDDGDSGGDS